MQVRVRLFAVLRERAGADVLELELPDGARVKDALSQIAPLSDGIPVVMAVNHEYADGELTLNAGDELALIPPVSGGAVHARVLAEPLSLDRLIERVRDPAAYAEMAERRLAAIAAEAAARHDICAAAVEHRVGTVPLSEPSVTIAVSAPHRAEAFAAAREIIDRVKAEAPIWKQEEGEWVPGVTPS
jgi:molybdopterin synthase catalytic subunit